MARSARHDLFVIITEGQPDEQRDVVQPCAGHCKSP
jgi:hypothetical protein